MKNVTFPLIALLLLSCVTLAGFAATPTTDYVLAFGSRVVADETTVGSIDLAPNDAIKAWFKAHGIDPAIIDAPLGTLSKAQKDAMDALFSNSDNLAALDALIQPELKASLVRGKIENANMRLGLRSWHLSVYGDEDR